MCEEDVYFMELVRYIHLNPLRAKLGRKQRVLGDERILGSGEFVERITKEADDRVKYQLSGHERRQKADSHITIICQREGINLEELKSGSRRGEVSRIRSKLALWLVEDCGIPLAEAGRQLGVSTSAVSKIIRRRKSNSI